MNYSELLQNIQNWAEDDSSEFQTDLPTIVARAEERIFRAVPNLLAFRDSGSGTLVIGTPTVAVPSGARILRSFGVDTVSGRVFLEQRTSTFIRDFWPVAATTGQPKFYCMQDSNTILLAPTPSAALAYVVEFAGIGTRLSLANPTTWLSTNASDVLLNASMVEALFYLKYVEKAAVWDQKLQESLALLQQEATRMYANEYDAGA